MYVCVCVHEVKPKIFRTGATIYTTVVIARSTGSNVPNCGSRALLRRFAATAWKRANTSPRKMAITDLAASPCQRPVSHFRPHPAVSGKIPNGCHPPPTVLPWFCTLWLPISKNGGDRGTCVYMREGTTSRVMAADRPYGEFYYFYASPEYFGYTFIIS
jgi:hypothetical protein